MSEIIERPQPVPDAATGPYWAAANEGRLVMPHCKDCGKYHFYPHPLCPHCNSAALDWVAVSGRGTLYSFTVVHRAPSKAFAGDVPYVVAVVELAEGPRLMSNLTGCAPEAAKIGMPVKVAFRKLAESVTLPVFEPQ